MSDIYQSLSFSPDRLALISGLLRYRAALRAAGITSGFQLVDGSFVEHSEVSRGRPPADIDVVTFAHLPVVGTDRAQFVQEHLNLFVNDQTKNLFHCDAYFVDLSKDPRLVATDSFYWYGLFAHQRETYLWKGMLRVSLFGNDDLAVAAAIQEAGE